MRRNLLILVANVALMSVAGAAPPAPPFVPPPPPPAPIAPLAPVVAQPALPQILIAEVLDPKSGTITTYSDQIVYKTVPQMVEEKVPVQVAQKKLVNGMEVVEIITTYQTVAKTSYVHVPVQQKIQKTWTATADSAYDIAGNKLSKEEMFKRLQPGMAVLVVPTGQKLQPVYQRLFSKDAVVLTFDGKLPK